MLSWEPKIDFSRNSLYVDSRSGPAKLCKRKRRLPLRRSEFDSQNACGGGKELPSKSCLPTSMCVVMCNYIVPCTHKQIQKFIFNKTQTVQY